MSRKRTLKKLQKRQESSKARLEELYLRGADDEFLALADEEIKNPAGSLLAAEWAEVAGRVLRQSLARADLGRLERLLPSLRRGGPLLPELALAEAVLDLAAGRLEAARSRLAALAIEGETTPFPRDLLAALQSLAQDGMENLPGDAPYLQAARELFDALRSLDRQAQARSAEALRAAAPAEAGEIHRLLDSAGRGLSLLADLAVLDEKLGRLAESDRSSTSQLVASWLRGPGPLLAATLTTAGPGLPALLRPLYHHVHLRWRDILERVAAREGPAGLAALCTADPRLLAVDVILPGGVQAGLASLRQGLQARQLLAGGHYPGLAHLLHTRGQTEPESATLAALWSLELWALNLRSKQEESAEGWFLDLDHSEPPPHRTLVRLQEMAGELGRRFPVERQAEVARVLSAELFDLCEQIPFCEHMARAALSLLEHQPGDLGLCIAGIAGAVAGEDPRSLRAIEVWLARGIKDQADDPAVARRLMTQVGREGPETIARSLDRLKPLFSGESWPAITALVAREMGAQFAEGLIEASFGAFQGGRRTGDRALAEIRGHLDRLRPALAGTPGFVAMELAVDCWQPDRSPVEKRVKAFLRSGPGLESVLAAFQVLDRAAVSPVTPGGVATALHALAQALIDLLDERWQLWAATVPDLAQATRGRHLLRLEEKIRQLLASPRLATGREALEHALRAVQTIRNARAGRAPQPDPPQQAGPKPKKPRRRRAGSPQFGLNFF